MQIDEKLVEKIHSDVTIVDAHLDLPFMLYENHKKGLYGALKRYVREYFTEGKVNVLVCAVFVDSGCLPEVAQREALGQLAAFYQEVAECPECMVCLSYQDILKAIENGKIALVLSFEGVEPLGSNLELLHLYYKLGIRVCGLVWARRNLAGDGAPFDHDERGQGNGLSEFGYKVIELADSLGMVIDIAHLNDQGSREVLDLMKKKPIISSHSCCRAVRKSPRNMSDELLKTLAENGGVVGMNTCSAIVAVKSEDGDIHTFAEHFAHAVKVAGADHVGLGFDFSVGYDMPVYEMVIENRVHKVFNAVKNYPGIKELTRALLMKGLSEQDIKKIYGGNFMRVFKEIL